MDLLIVFVIWGKMGLFRAGLGPMLGKMPVAVSSQDRVRPKSILAECLARGLRRDGLPGWGY
jgi:hypothetical protein